MMLLAVQEIWSLSAMLGTAALGMAYRSLIVQGYVDSALVSRHYSGYSSQINSNWIIMYLHKCKVLDAIVFASTIS